MMNLQKIKDALKLLDYQVHYDVLDELKRVKKDENLYERLYNNESLSNLEEAEKYLNWAIDELEEFIKINEKEKK